MENFRRVIEVVYEFCLTERPGTIVLLTPTDEIPRWGFAEWRDEALDAAIKHKKTTPDAVADWRKKSKKSQPIKGLDPKVKVVEYAAVEPLFLEHPDWSSFRKKYGETSVLRLSDVGFSSDNKSAVIGVTLAWNPAPPNGYWTSFICLHQTKDGWTIVGRFRVDPRPDKL